MHSPLRGECLTLNIGDTNSAVPLCRFATSPPHCGGVFPNEENASTLSQILQENVPEKYYLSPKACQGILRRASARGKQLPPMLKIALEQQALTDTMVS